MVASSGGRKDIPDTVSPGYGELARSGFDKVVHYLCEEAPEWMRMDSECRFLDIGSGFGKCVLHAKVRGRVKESAGIEFIPVRHEKAAETLHYLRARFVPGLTDGKSAEAIAGEAELMALMNAIDLDGVSLIQGDITDERHHHLLYRASHIYMFDVVFSDVTMRQILPLIEQSNFALFACYHRPSYLERLGCHQFVCIHKMAMKTTGKQTFTCYFYAKASAGTRVTRTKERLWAKQEPRKKEGEGSAPPAAAHPPKKRKTKSHHWYKKRRVQQQQQEQEEQEEEEVEEQEAEEELAEEEEEEEEEEEVRPKSHKSRGIRQPKATSAPLVSVLEPPRPRQLTNTAAESLAFDTFTAMIAKTVAALLVAEQEAADRAARREQRRADRLQRLQAAEPTQPDGSPSRAASATSLDRPQRDSGESTSPAKSLAASASVPVSAKPLTIRAQRQLEVEAAKKLAVPLLSSLLPEAVSAAVSAIEKGQRTSTTLLLEALEQPLDCLAEPVPVSMATPTPTASAPSSAPALSVDAMDDDEDDEPLALRYPRLSMKREEEGGTLTAAATGKRKLPSATPSTAGLPPMKKSHKRRPRAEEAAATTDDGREGATSAEPSSPLLSLESSHAGSAQVASTEPAPVPMEAETKGVDPVREMKATSQSNGALTQMMAN